MLATVLPVAVFMLILYRLWSVYIRSLRKEKLEAQAFCHVASSFEALFFWEI